jgi:hypothetical protein
MTSDSRSRASQLALLFATLALLAVAALTLLRLSSFGIWDPWELSVADQARKLAEERLAPGRSTPLPLRWIAAAFSMFGPREWAGRLPAVLSGLGLLATGGLLVRRFAGGRAAVYAVIALGTTPFFLLHARLMLGSTPALLGAALVALGAAAAVFPAASPARPESPHAPYLWLVVSALGALLGVWSAGVMLTVLPALGAIAVVSLFVGPSTPQPRAREQARLFVIAAAALCAVMVVRAALRREAEYSVWLGGSPLEGSVPTYERVLEQLFHSFAPWSALLPLALAALLRLDRARADQPLRLLCVAWSALAYASQTLYLSSYGHAVFPAPLALAAAVAIWLADGDEEPHGDWPQAIVGLLLLGLVIRDYALYPASPVGGLGLSDTKLPDTFNPKHVWAALFGAFALGLVISSLAKREQPAIDLRAPYRGIARLFATSPGHKIWLLVAALGGLGCLVFGVVAYVPSVPLTTLGRRVGKVLLLIPIALPVAVALGQIGVALSAKLASARHAVMLAASIAIAGYASQVFLPKLSAQFSPRDVFDAYNKLADAKEPLAQHQVESGAATYYVKGDVRELKARSQLLEYLGEPGRRWAAIPSDQLADIDKAFRRKTGRHLFVPSAENARVSLVASQPVEGHADQNPLARFVVSEPPPVEVSVGANYDDKIELIGYNLELPAKDSVGAGQTFHITWVWRALQGNLGAYKSFVHVDAPNQRINGDHDPVDGKYPVRLWESGDVIVDRQAMHVPATYRPGRYVMYVGFYRGDSRLKVVKGAQDGQDRVRAGTIEVR